MNRRTILNGLLGSAAMGWAAPLSATPQAATQSDLRPDVQLGEPSPFDPEMIARQARRLAAEPYQPRPEVPQAWRDLTYPQYRDIRFDQDRAVWQDSDAPARLDLFAPGLYFPRAVQIHVVADGEARQIAFDPALFTMGDEVPDLPYPDDLGFSGLRLRGSFTHPGFGEEYFVLQGASYFRSLGIGQAYGLSARGLAINTGGPEEFPEFTAFWVERPAAHATKTVIHALLDSPSVTGAYRFEVTPGETTTAQITARLYPRVALETAGLAPLTSMFLFDSTNRDRFSDFRPAVHDSEGLSMVTGHGEHIWRPLANPKTVQISAFKDINPKGFGLLQRHRSFGDFADLEANYHRRPSAWVVPDGNWGPGHVMLVEIPADKEIYDNIVAFWRPDAPLQPGQETRLSYRLSWGNDPFTATELLPVRDTRMGRDPFGQGHTVVIDFAPGPGTDDLTGVIPLAEANGATTRGAIVQRNPETGGPRLAFHFDPGDASLVELRAGLTRGGQPLTETWLYRWTA